MKTNWCTGQLIVVYGCRFSQWLDRAQNLANTILPRSVKEFDTALGKPNLEKIKAFLHSILCSILKSKPTYFLLK